MTRKVRGPYSKSDGPILSFKDSVSMTKQSFTDECNINNIMARYQKTGVINHLSEHGGDYGFCDGATFTENMMVISRAQNMFNDLPSSAREFFEHDPAKFLDYVDNIDPAADAEQLLELGLLDPQSAMELTIKKDSAIQNPTDNPTDPAPTDQQPIDPT